MKKKLLLVGGAFVIFAVGIAIGSGGDEPPVASGSTTTTAVADQAPMATDVIGKRGNQAEDILESAGFTVEFHEEYGDSLIVRPANWVVVSQEQVGDVVYLGVDRPESSTTTTTTPKVTTTSKPKATTTTTAPKPTTTQPQVTRSQENAISKAESYLDFIAFSRSGLIDQLEFEGFSNSEATFAVDYLDVDWNEQAWLKAEEYLDFTSFSRSGLIDQLIFEGFTREQAVYGVDRAGL